MLTGIILGPSIIKHVRGGRYYPALRVFKQGRMMNFLEFLSLALYAYVVGVRTDIAVIKSSGRLPWFIGIVAFVFPIAVAYIAFAIVKGNFPAEPADHLFHLCPLVANTSIHVVSVLLEDLNLLNSQIGRIALSSSLISSLCSWIFRIFMNFWVWSKFMKKGPVVYVFSLSFRVVLAVCIVYGLRPVMLWVIRKIPEGKSMKESHFFFMTVILFGVGFASESLGYGAMFGTMILGLAMPPGPPLGSGVVERLNLFVSTVLLPSYIVNAGRSVDVVLITETAANYAFAVLLIVLGALLAKIVAAVVLSRLCRLPYKDALTLGLIVSSQGFFDVINYKRALTNMQIHEEIIFTIVILVVALNAAIASPLIRHLYDPSKRYLSYKRRTIQHSVHEHELRILVCMHEEEEVYSITNVLKASHPTIQTPLAVYVLDLMELVGRDQPLLINHQFHRDRSSTVTRTDRIISAFCQFEQHHQGLKHQHFTAIAPFASMHDDICTLTLDKNASFFIIPFHKYNECLGRTEVKRNVLDKAPCSVGILVDKKIIMHWRTTSKAKSNSAHGEAKFRACVIFLGGADSREALAYGMRMAENPDAVSVYCHSTDFRSRIHG